MIRWTRQVGALIVKFPFQPFGPEKPFWNRSFHTLENLTYRGTVLFFIFLTFCVSAVPVSAQIIGRPDLSVTSHFRPNFVTKLGEVLLGTVQDIVILYVPSDVRFPDGAILISTKLASRYFNRSHMSMGISTEEHSKVPAARI